MYNQDHKCDHTPVDKHQYVPQSINTKFIVNEWRDDNIDGGEYDGNRDDDEISRQSKKYMIPPLQLRGGLKYDNTFKHMMEADVDLFGVNDTYADKMNGKNNKVLETS